MRRALLPVAGGIAFFVVLGLLLWGVAALLSDNPDRVNERLAATTFDVGNVETIAAIVAEDGPLIFHDLVDAGGERSLVLDHTGDAPDRGWVVYFAHPADRGATCKVTQVRGTRTFTDCEGRTIDVDDLQPPAGVAPYVSGDTIGIDLRGATTGTAPAPPTS